MNRPAPLTINNARQQRQITLQWSAQETQTIAHARLRGICPCAKCRVLRLQGRIILVDENIQLQAINNMGYGVQLVFSDGHDRGIYPWAYLYELNVCAN